MAKKYFFGFTLIELLITVAIISLLAILVMNTFVSQIAKGNDAKRKADLNRIKVAVEEYEKDHNCYPATVVCPTDTGLNPYLKNIPCDPVTHDSYYYEPESDTSCPRWFRVYAILQNTKDSSLIQGIGPGCVYNYYRSSENAPVPSCSGVTPTNTPSSTPTTTPFGDGGNYGCNKSEVCVPIGWDPNRPGWECDPNFAASDCGLSNEKGCSGPNKWPECVHW